MRRLILGLLGAAAAALLSTAQFHVRAPAGVAFPGSGAIAAMLASGPVGPEVRTASDRAPKAPPEQAARRRRGSTAPGAGALPAPVVGAISAAVILIIPGPLPVATRPGDCIHCTSAARPPPIS